MQEKENYLTDQLITYIGNKRSLLDFISVAVDFVKSETGKEKLHCLDVFSGSGIVSRFLKAHAESLTVNDLELYSRIINSCYLANQSEINSGELKAFYEKIRTRTEQLLKSSEKSGFIHELYAPEETENVRPGERCFYTAYNARYIDFMRRAIETEVPENLRHFFIAPLLSQASVHANTAGIFKGFYKNSKTGVGRFGGNARNALSRICSDIVLPFPVFSNFECPVRIFQNEANELSEMPELYAALPEKEFDLVYMDPPYNQHPYGSNYFMLNLILKNRLDVEVSRVSGITQDWNHSVFNKASLALNAMEDIIGKIDSKFVIVSYNSEGFITFQQMTDMLKKYGSLKTVEINYNAFRGSRNLSGRDIYVSEYLFVLEK